ncbi:alpha/beta fold hydrolase [Mycobacterium colombiense]
MLRRRRQVAVDVALQAGADGRDGLLSPTIDELSAGMERLNSSDLLARHSDSPMLVINGADDYFIPQSDTPDFRRRRNTEVHLIEGTGHVAMSKAPEVVPKIIAWVRGQMATPAR